MIMGSARADEKDGGRLFLPFNHPQLAREMVAPYMKGSEPFDDRTDRQIQQAEENQPSQETRKPVR